MDNIDPDDVKAIKGIPNLLYVDHDTNYIVCYTTLWSQVDSIVEDFARLVHVPFSKWRRDPPNFGVRGKCYLEEKKFHFIHHHHHSLRQHA